MRQLASETPRCGSVCEAEHGDAFQLAERCRASQREQRSLPPASIVSKSVVRDGFRAGILRSKGNGLSHQCARWFTMTASVAGCGFFIRTNSPPVRNDRRAAPSFGERITKRSRFVKPTREKAPLFYKSGQIWEMGNPTPRRGWGLVQC